MSKPKNTTPTARLRPWLHPGEMLDARRAVELAGLLRAGGGDEILYRIFDAPKSAPPAASRLRRILGTDFHVRVAYDLTPSGRERGLVYARARKAGEPMFSKRRLRMDPDHWLTLDQAADRLGVSTEWLRTEYLNTGVLARHKYARRVVVRTEDVDRLNRERARGGLFGRPRA